MDKQTYIALTIGPIYKTFQNVRKTRELWAASFCFSFIMRKINEYLRKNGINNHDFILPFFDQKTTLPVIYDSSKKEFIVKGYGMFPDRIIFKSKEGDILLLKKAIEFSFNELVDIITRVSSSPDKEKIRQFLDNYFQISYIEKTLHDTTSENIILALSPYLDTLEQQNKFISVEHEKNYLYDFFTHVNKRDSETDKTFLDEHYEIKDINNNHRVESLIEIATRELIEKISNKEYKYLVNHNLWNPKNEDRGSTGEDNPDTDTDSKFLKGLVNKCNDLFPKKEDNPFSAYHKYFCIIKADGDKMGTTLKGLHNLNEVQSFGDNLAKWAIETYKLINDYYKGVPIYIGGDDLLCIVPVANGNSNVFDLIGKIDGSFKKQFPDKYPTLSFGLSITYYKHPLSEALDIADKLLRQAKNAGGNTVAAQIVKHSGNEMAAVFHKTSELYKETLQLFLTLLNDKSVSNSAVAYKIRENEKVFEQIGLDEQRVVNFINHITGADEGSEAVYTDITDEEKFFFLLKKMIYQIYHQNADAVIEKNIKEISENSIKDIYSIMRIIKFVKGLDDDKS